MPHFASFASSPASAPRFRFLGCAVAAVLCLAGCDLPSAASEDRFTSRTRTPVYPITDSTFEVGLRPGQSFRAFWCSAADFARREKGADWQDRIYVSRGLGRGRISGAPDAVEFSLTPVAATTPDSFVRLGNQFRVGDVRTVSSANGECHSFLRGTLGDSSF